MSDFSNKLIEWYELNKRDLPWRNTKDPYKIWLSEIILQQTRVQQGLPYYLAFEEAFPTIQNFANATEEEVLRLWQGLGYYSRARNMHFTAKHISENLSSEFPTNFKDLLKLKGVGNYTAAAIASFAFGEKVATVDGNVYRVLSRIFGIDSPINSTNGIKEFAEVANTLISDTQPDTFNQALMEFGAIHCTPKSPNCLHCPFVQECEARKQNRVGELPVKLKKTKVTDRYFHYLVIEENEKYWIKERKGKGIWQGLYDFPLLESDHKELNLENIDQLTEDLELKTFLQENAPSQISEMYKHILSHQRLHIHFYHYKVDIEKSVSLFSEKDEYSLMDLDNIEKQPKPIIIHNYLNTYFY
ncbi:A/G-specific adenine glycosylase [Sediminitomix flava]|uniref:Adenine DNA glycosylase n=1 Tax=Sediminitomix flava TaxID=379075 RepID=A0A315ZNH4_SEDFL|nr:A/G-specific adenine glycosylase [Sediminitomix flava]PWJ36059.1 A/G-specific DNA-adenine glycosylase [Sediminitomix flava]